MKVTLTTDLRAEADALHDLLEGHDEAFWRQTSQFKDWTVWDIVSHLHFSDHMALTAATGDAAFARLQQDLTPVFAGGQSLKDYGNRWVGPISGAELLARWYEMVKEMCDTFDKAPAGARYKWFGPDMGVRMFATARQMEIWAHGQAIYDLMGLERENTDRIKNIVVIGIKTFGFNFSIRGEPVPETMPFVSLKAPSGEIWTFGEADSGERIEGSAVEFAQVMTQTRNIADTSLIVTGDIAARWTAIAQCFAGGVEEPPAPGTRHRISR